MSPRLRFSVCWAILFVCSVLGLYGQNEEGKNPAPKAARETVFLKVSVSDPLNRYASGLKKEHFKVFEDKAEQEIVFFEQKAAPISIGIILDTSSSMKEDEYKEQANKAILQLLKSANTQDESFLILFNKTTRLIENLSQQSFSLDDDRAFQSGGNTALYDAIYLGLSQIGRCNNDSKALILITDGEDNSSTYSSKDVLEFAKQSNTQIYSIGHLEDLGHGMAIIREMVRATGGRAFFPGNLGELYYYINLIQFELRSQCVLGYKPTNQSSDGKWRRIKVELNPPKRFPKLKVHVREGYYGPKY